MTHPPEPHHLEPDPSEQDRSRRTSADPYRPFRPRRGALVARGTALLTVALFTIVAFTMPALEISGTVLIDRVLMIAFGAGCAAFIYRYARLRAIPSTQGLVVVNLMRTRELRWEQVMQVGFSGGAPWAVLELTDTEEVPVMAIQRADGAFGRSEASRLAALVAHHAVADRED